MLHPAVAVGQNRDRARRRRYHLWAGPFAGSCGGAQAAAGLATRRGGVQARGCGQGLGGGETVGGNGASQRAPWAAEAWRAGGRAGGGGTPRSRKRLRGTGATRFGAEPAGAATGRTGRTARSTVSASSSVQSSATAPRSKSSSFTPRSPICREGSLRECAGGAADERQVQEQSESDAPRPEVGAAPRRN